MREKNIRRYKLFMNFLSATLGPDYEIVLTDLKTIVEIRNGAISGRKAGAPLSDIALKIIRDKEYLHKDFLLNYQGHTESGKLLRCSTFFIKENDSTLTGLLCINFDDQRYKELSEKIFSLCHPNEYRDENISITQIQNENHEKFYSDINILTDDALQKVAGSSMISGDRLTYTEKLDIIRNLYESGVFDMKGTIPVIADRIGASQASMYRYLSIIKKEKNG